MIKGPSEATQAPSSGSQDVFEADAVAPSPDCVYISVGNGVVLTINILERLMRLSNFLLQPLL